MEKAKKFFEKAKVWIVGFLTVAVVLGVVVLLFIPDASFSKFAAKLNFWSKRPDPQVISLNDKVNDLEKIIKSQDDEKKEVAELKKQLASLAKNDSSSTENSNPKVQSTTRATIQSSVNRQMVESRPITNPGNLEQYDLNRGNTGTGEKSGKININTASASQLDSLPGIGPAYAQRIIDYRESHGGFKSISEIQNIKGIGPKTFEKLRDKITV